MTSTDSILRLLQNERGSDGARVIVVATIIATCLVIVAGWFYTQSSVMRQQIPEGSHCEELVDSKRSSNNSNDNKCEVNDRVKLRDVFTVKQKPPLLKASENTKISERPFGSSYYYAHNNPKSKGGYSDGLRDCDFIMNSPRLLSVGGIRVADETEVEAVQEILKKQIGHALCTDQDQTNVSNVRSEASTHITSYLWDDDGKVDVAKIHIDSLPLSSTATLSWKDASISKENVVVRLTGEHNDGLFVSVTGQDNEKYHLRVPKMFGPAESVNFTVKKNKLLIKLTKKKIPKRLPSSSEGLWGTISGLWGQMMMKYSGDTNKSEYVVWPTLSAGGWEIDEKMFKQVDSRD